MCFLTCVIYKKKYMFVFFCRRVLFFHLMIFAEV